MLADERSAQRRWNEGNPSKDVPAAYPLTEILYRIRLHPKYTVVQSHFDTESDALFSALKNGHF